MNARCIYVLRKSVPEVDYRDRSDAVKQPGQLIGPGCPRRVLLLKCTIRASFCSDELFEDATTAQIAQERKM